MELRVGLFEKMFAKPFGLGTVGMVVTPFPKQNVKQYEQSAKHEKTTCDKVSDTDYNHITWLFEDTRNG